MDIVAAATAGATNLSLFNALEINPSIQTGASVMRRATLQLSAPSVHVNRGALWDNEILSFRAAGAATFRNGLMFGSALSGTSPAGTDSTLIGAQFALDFTATANFGIDFNNATFTKSSIRVPGAEFAHTGALRLGGAFLTPTAAGLSIDAVGSVATSVATTRASGGTGYIVNEIMDDGLGGVYCAIGVSGAAVTSLVTLVLPTYPTTSPPSTVTLTSRAPGVGTGCTATPTWSTNRTTLALQPSGGATKIGGNIGFNGATPISKPTVTGSKGGNAALASVITALASYGLLTDSST